jgi:hypothetical protein
MTMLRKRSAPIGIAHYQEEDALELVWMLLLQILVVFDVFEISTPSSIIVVTCIGFLNMSLNFELKNSMLLKLI